MSSKLARVVILLLLAIVVAIAGVSVLRADSVQWTGISIIAAAALAGVVAMFARRDVAPEEAQLNQTRSSLNDEHKTLKGERGELEELRKAIEVELGERARQLDAREVALDNRLVTFQEWLEYPQTDQQPLLNRAQSDTQLAKKDQQVLDLLEKEAKDLYERIKGGFYKTSDQGGDDGKFNVDRARKDALALVLAVARIYKPDAEDPLLETNVSEVLRAASRTCLHLLIVLERLPLSLHDKSLSTIYSYIQRAVKAYDVYQAASPYLGFASRAFNLGRFTVGANPLAAGITWALTEFGKHGVKKLTSKFVDQQAVGVLQDLVRVVGFEVAGIYSGDFRHRDPNWVFGSELTQLMSHFPVSRESLSRALREIGGLQFRNEYDRVYLYRCLSTHRSAAPLQNAVAVLSTQDCQAVVKRLESFYRSFMHGRTERRTETWRDGVEERLGVKLSLPTRKSHGVDEGTVNQDLLEVLESLVGFLIAVKGLNPATAINGLAKCQSAIAADSDQMHLIIRHIEDQPPHVFAPPDIDVESELLASYLADLGRLAVYTKPWEIQVDDVVLETAAYFGQDLAAARKQLDAVYVALAGTTLVGNAPTRKLEAGPLRSALPHLDSDETIQFVFPGGKFGRPFKAIENVTLVATTSRLLVVSSPESGGVLLECPLRSARIVKVEGLLIDDVKVSNSAWQIPFTEETHSASIVFTKPMISRFDTWFRCLLDLK